MDGSVVRRGQRLHQRQPDPQSVARPFQRGVELGEHVEHVGELRSGDADAVVAHADDRLTTLVRDRERDVAARVRSRGLGQQDAFPFIGLPLASHVTDNLRRAYNPRRPPVRSL